MTNTNAISIAVLPGDGIGAEVIDATIPLLERVARDAPFAFRFAALSRPARSTTRRPATRCPTATLAAARAADAILFGAMGWPAIRYPDGTEIAPQLDLRVALELYAGVRPARAIPGIPLPLADPRAQRHRPRRRARIDRRPVRVARTRRDRSTTARRATRW